MGFAVLFTATLLTSCAPWAVKEIGRMNSMSVRNIDPHANYVCLQKNVEYTFKESKENMQAKLEDAVDQLVKKVPGGEYVMNAKVKLLSKDEKPVGYIVEGDVWGIPLLTAPAPTK